MFRSISTEHEHEIWWVCRDLPRKSPIRVFSGEERTLHQRGQDRRPGSGRGGKSFPSATVLSRTAGRIWKKCESKAEKNGGNPKRRLMTSRTVDFQNPFKERDCNVCENWRVSGYVKRMDQYLSILLKKLADWLYLMTGCDCENTSPVGALSSLR